MAPSGDSRKKQRTDRDGDRGRDKYGRDREKSGRDRESDRDRYGRDRDSDRGRDRYGRDSGRDSGRDRYSRDGGRDNGRGGGRDNGRDGGRDSGRGGGRGYGRGGDRFGDRGRFNRRENGFHDNSNSFSGNRNRRGVGYDNQQQRGFNQGFNNQVYDLKQRIDERINMNKKCIAPSGLWNRSVSPKRPPKKEKRKRRRKRDESSGESADDHSDNSDDDKQRRKKKSRRTKKESSDESDEESPRRRKKRRPQKKQDSDSSSSEESGSEDDSSDEDKKSIDEKSVDALRELVGEKPDYIKLKEESESSDDESGSKRSSKRPVPQSEIKDDSEEESDIEGEKEMVTSNQSAPVQQEERDIGPSLPVEHVGQLDSRSYGGALMPGEGSAIASYVQRGMRIPRRGEIGLSSVEIEDFEGLGFVMSGSRHKRMNAIRIRKENQVYSAEEKRALALINFEEKAAKEKKILTDLRKYLKSKTDN